MADLVCSLSLVLVVRKRSAPSCTLTTMTSEILTFQDAVAESRRNGAADSLANLFSVFNEINGNYLSSGLDVRMVGVYQRRWCC